MKFALDFDKTYNADYALWDRFIRMATDAGHEVRIVTARDERKDLTPELRMALTVAEFNGAGPAIFTRGIAKAWYCLHFGEGFVPDVWIDDKPVNILNNSTTSPDDLDAWRANRPEGAHVGRL